MRIGTWVAVAIGLLATRAGGALAQNRPPESPDGWKTVYSEFADGLPVVVEAQVETERTRLVISYGTSDSSFSETWAKERGLIGPKLPPPIGFKSGVVLPSKPSKETPTDEKLGDLHLNIGGILFSLPKADTVKMERFPLPFPAPVQGVLQSDALRQIAIEIDYFRKTVRVHAPETLRMNGKSGPIPIYFGYAALLPVFVAREGGEPIATHAIINSDEPYALEVSDILARQLGRTDLGEPDDTGKLGSMRIQRVAFGNVVLRDVPATIRVKRTASGAHASIGQDLLSRLKLTLDFSRSRMFVEATPEMGHPFASERYVIEALQGRGWVVRTVPDDQPNDAIQIRVGDAVVALDGETLTVPSPADLAAGCVPCLTIRRFRPGSKDVVVRIMRDGKEEDVTIPAKKEAAPVRRAE